MDIYESLPEIIPTPEHPLEPEEQPTEINGKKVLRVKPVKATDLVKVLLSDPIGDPRLHLRQHQKRPLVMWLAETEL